MKNKNLLIDSLFTDFLEFLLIAMLSLIQKLSISFLLFISACSWMASLFKSLSSNSLTKNKFDSIKTSYFHSQVQQLNHFPKALTTNDDTLFVYIKHLVTGSNSDQKNYNQYIFNHLKNVIDHQFSTLTLRNTCKFIMTLILLGNLHIYEKIVKYLLPSMVNKINQSISQSTTKTDLVKPIWHLTQFFTQTIYVLAQWIPQDFYNLQKPSIFAKIKQKYHLQIKQFKYFNMEKIVFCYRIIKDLGLINLEQKCDQCDKKSKPQKGKQKSCHNFKKHFHQKSRVQNRKNILKINSNRGTDFIWETGFEIFTELNSEEEWSQKTDSQKQERPRLRSKKVWSPDEYDCLNTRQIKQKQMQIVQRFKDMRTNVRDLGNGLYELEQKKLLRQYDSKRKKVKQFNNHQFGSLKNLAQLEKNYQFNPANNSKNTSTARKQTHFPSMPYLSPLKKQTQQNKTTQLDHISTFTYYINSKSPLFQNKFKIALISTKGNVHLKKIGNFTLKCRTFCRQKMLKLKLFVRENQEQTLTEVRKHTISSNRKGELSKLATQQSQLTQFSSEMSIPAIQFQYIEPKRCLDSYKSGEQNTELILNYGNRNQNIMIQPILIKLNNEAIYLPVGYWHMVRRSSKKLFQTHQIQTQYKGSQTNLVAVCRKQKILLNKDIAKSLHEILTILLKQFQLSQHSNAKDKDFYQRPNTLRSIQLRGSIMHVNFMIGISSDTNRQSGKAPEEYLSFTGKVENNEYIDPQNNSCNSQRLYVQTLIDELVFVFGKSND